MTALSKWQDWARFGANGYNQGKISIVTGVQRGRVVAVLRLDRLPAGPVRIFGPSDAVFPRFAFPSRSASSPQVDQEQRSSIASSIQVQEGHNGANGEERIGGTPTEEMTKEAMDTPSDSGLLCYHRPVASEPVISG